MARYSYRPLADVSVIGTELQAHFGFQNVTIHTTSTTKLIFTCPAISDKPVKMDVSGNNIRIYYGNAFVAGTQDLDVNRAVMTNTTSAQIGYHLLLTNNSLLISIASGIYYTRVGIIGKLSNNEYAICAAGMSNVSATSLGFLTATDTSIRIMGVYDEAFTSSGKILKRPLHIQDLVSGTGLDSNGKVAHFEGIWACSKATGKEGHYKGVDFFITPSELYMNGSTTIWASRCSLLVDGIE